MIANPPPPCYQGLKHIDVSWLTWMILKQIIWWSVLTVFTSILLENFLKYFIISYQSGFSIQAALFYNFVSRIVFPCMEYQLFAKSLSVLWHCKILLGYPGLI